MSSWWRRFTHGSHDFRYSVGVKRWSALVLSCGNLASLGKQNILFLFYFLHSFLKDPFWTFLTEGSVTARAVGTSRVIAVRTAVVSSLSTLGTDFSTLAYFLAVTEFLTVKAMERVIYI